MIPRIFSETPLSFHLLAVVYCRFTVGDLYDRHHNISYAQVVVDAAARLPCRETSGLDIGHPLRRRCRRRRVHRI